MRENKEAEKAVHRLTVVPGFRIPGNSVLGGVGVSSGKSWEEKELSVVVFGKRLVETESVGLKVGN